MDLLVEIAERISWFDDADDFLLILLWMGDGVLLYEVEEGIFHLEVVTALVDGLFFCEGGSLGGFKVVWYCEVDESCE